MNAFLADRRIWRRIITLRRTAPAPPERPGDDLKARGLPRDSMSSWWRSVFTRGSPNSCLRWPRPSTRRAVAEQSLQRTGHGERREQRLHRREPGANHFTDTCPDVAGRETREGRLMNVPHDKDVQKFRELLGDQLRSPDHG
jgi:hypothetical protein